VYPKITKCPSTMTEMTEVYKYLFFIQEEILKCIQIVYRKVKLDKAWKTQVYWSDLSAFTHSSRQ